MLKSCPRVTELESLWKGPGINMLKLSRRSCSQVRGTSLERYARYPESPPEAGVPLTLVPYKHTEEGTLSNPQILEYIQLEKCITKNSPSLLFSFLTFYFEIISGFQKSKNYTKNKQTKKTTHIPFTQSPQK